MIEVHAGTDGGIVALDATGDGGADCRARAVLSRGDGGPPRPHRGVNGTYNAIVSLTPADALLADADAAVAHGDALGPLHGLPHAIKDLAATKGLRTTFGSPLYADFVPTHDALFVERLRAAGAILIGKTNVPEFGLGSHSYNRVFCTTRNAYDPALSAGGSSGGAGAALALCMVPLADGSDFMGSLRNPAGWNGVFGLRLSAGRVPSLPEPETTSSS